MLAGTIGACLGACFPHTGGTTKILQENLNKLRNGVFNQSIYQVAFNNQNYVILVSRTQWE